MIVPARVIAWGLTAVAMVLIVAAVVFAVVTGAEIEWRLEAFIWAIAVMFGVMGAVVASRHPRNAIGWLFVAASVSAGLSNVAGAYAQYFVDTGQGPHLLGASAAVYGELSWMPFILLPATFLLALFPDGHLLSPRWRPIAWCAGVGMATNFVVEVMAPGPIADYPTLENPFTVDSPVIVPLEGLTVLLIFIGLVGSSISLIVRFRRSRGEERQQIKWLALAGVIAVVTIVSATTAYELLGEHLADSVMMLSVLGLPAASGIAILRYRLYDIDVVINRTLVYGALTALLAAVYLGSVLLLQLALESFTQGSGLAVAGSTLATAALVRPARARIQQIVDRRFFRSKYDARVTLEGFGSHLRDQVDIADIGTDLIAVVSETVQPAHASLWLRGTEPGR